MTLYIKQGKIFYFEVFVDKKSFFSETPFEEKAVLLNNALENLENDINNLAKRAINNKYFNFFWEFTYDIHRDDGIKNTVADYYLIEIIKSINDKFNIDRVEILFPLDKSVFNMIMKIIKVKMVYKKNFIHTSKIFFRNHFGALKYILKYFMHTFKLKNNNYELVGGNKVFFLTDNQFNIDRFKNFPSLMNDLNDVYSLNLSLLKVKNYLKNDYYLIKSYSFKLFITSIYNTIKTFITLKSVIAKQKNKSIYSRKLNEQSFLQTYYLVLRYKTLEKIFLFYKPKFIVVATTVGDPLKRMVLSVAQKCDISTIVFSCRSAMSYLRAEDRVINFDFNKVNGNFFVNYFISFDKISKQHLINFGVKDDKIFTFNDNETNKDQQLTTFKDGLLLLFAHKQYNDELIDLIGRKGLEYNNLYYREHPSLKLSIKQLELLKKINTSIICITDFKWSEISFTDVIALTSNSTSGIDVSANGASIIWLPFLTEHSTQFKPLMDAIGKVCYDENEFINFMKNLNKKDRISFNDKCKKQYHQNIFERSTMSEFLNQIS